MYKRRFHSRSSFEPIPNGLSELRIKAEKTQKQVAEEIGLSRGVLAMFESEYCIPNATLRKTISDYYDEPEDKIFPLLTAVIAARRQEVDKDADSTD